MKSPIHVRCARSGELCDECRAKNPSDLDVKLTALLSRIEEKEKIGEVNFVGSIETENTVFILLKSDPSKLIGRHGRIIKHIKAELGKRVRLVNVTDKETVMRDLFYPIKPKYISKVFSPNGSYTKLVLPRGALDKLRIAKEELEKVIKELVKEDMEIVEE